MATHLILRLVLALLIFISPTPSRAFHDPEPTPSVTPPPVSPSPPAQKLTPDQQITRIDSSGKTVFAIGDLHGDFRAAVRTLWGVGAINEKYEWVGKHIIVVQLGDLIDRGKEDMEILNLMRRLEKEAPKYGSQLIVLNGNHEFINVAGDLKDAHLESLPLFTKHLEQIPNYLKQSYNWSDVQVAEELKTLSRYWETELQSTLSLLDEKSVPNLLTAPSALIRSFFELYYPHHNYPTTLTYDLKKALIKKLKHRAILFSRGFPIARKFAQRHPFVVVGDTVFVHGGLLPEHLEYGLDKIEAETQAWLTDRSIETPDRLQLYGPAAFQAPWWTRELILDPNQSKQCERLSTVLKALKVRRMVVGHTVTPSTSIENSCHAQLLRIDVALSGAFWPQYGNIRPKPYETLKIGPTKDGHTPAYIISTPVF
jgi:hypothetical protein